MCNHAATVCRYKQAANSGPGEQQQQQQIKQLSQTHVGLEYFKESLILGAGLASCQQLLNDWYVSTPMLLIIKRFEYCWFFCFTCYCSCFLEIGLDMAHFYGSRNIIKCNQSVAISYIIALVCVYHN